MSYTSNACAQMEAGSVSSDAPIDILLVEDVFSDVLLTRISLDATHIAYKLSNIRRGDQLLPYLTKYRHHYPDLILLDLGLPGMGGFEILAGLGENPEAVRSIPIVILSGLQCGEYFLGGSYPLRIIDYIGKPCSVEQMRDVLMHVRKDKDSQGKRH